MKVDLSTYNNDTYSPGGSKVKRFVWYIVNAIIFKSYWFPVTFIKVFFLRIFGATVGSEVTIKPCVNIKYPWFLKIGDYVWIGEEVWIDNLTNIEIANNVCISQGAMLLTGNHTFNKPSFDLIVKEIVLEEGVWIGARAIVCPGVCCASHSVLTVSSIATRNLEPWSIYQGNPAVKIRMRELKCDS